MPAELKKCFMCDAEGQYRCPTCMIRYCSVGCFKTHKESNKCKVKTKRRNETLKEIEFKGEDTLSQIDLEKLRNDENVKRHLSNKYLRNIITEIVSEGNGSDVRFSLDAAMQEPIFAEFAAEMMNMLRPPETD